MLLEFECCCVETEIWVLVAVSGKDAPVDGKETIKLQEAHVEGNVKADGKEKGAVLLQSSQAFQFAKNSLTTLLFHTL